MSKNASNDSDSSGIDSQTFNGEYNAFGVFGKTTSNPSTLVWLEGHEGMKFGLHHPSTYLTSEVFGWLVNNVRRVRFTDVPQYAVENDLRMAVKRSPEVTAEYISAEEVWPDR